MKSNVIGVYRIWCVGSGRSYVGSSTTDIGTRLRTHFYGLRRGSHHSVLMQEDWGRYGGDSFRWEVLKECSAGECAGGERAMIERYNANDPTAGYNTSEIRNVVGLKKRGRPSSGRVNDGALYFRLPKERVAEVREVVKGYLLNRPRTEAGGGSVVKEVVIKEVLREVGVGELDEAKKQAYAAACRNDELEAQVKDLTARLERCSRATDDEKCRWWMMKYDKLLAETRGGGEYDQTRG